MTKKPVIDIVKLIVSALIGALVTYFTFLSIETRQNKIDRVKQIEQISSINKDVLRINGDYLPSARFEMYVEDQEYKFNDIIKKVDKMDDKLDKIQNLLIERKRIADEERVYKSIINKSDSIIIYLTKMKEEQNGYTN